MAILLNAVHDSYVDKQNPTVNFGSSVNLIQEHSAGVVLINVVLRFNVFDNSRVPQSIINNPGLITSATVALNVNTKGVGGNPTIRLSRSNVIEGPFWDEDTVTWNSKPASPSAPSTDLLITSTGVKVWIITDTLKSILSNNNQNEFQMSTLFESAVITFDSDESSGIVPLLTINHSSFITIDGGVGIPNIPSHNR